MNTGAGDSGGDDSLGDGRKGGKRELSQSKRAAQNRAAQVCRVDFFRRGRSRSCCGVPDDVVKLPFFSFEDGSSSCFVNSHVIHPTSSRLT